MLWGTDCHSQCAHWLRNDKFFESLQRRLFFKKSVIPRSKATWESVLLMPVFEKTSENEGFC